MDALDPEVLNPSVDWEPYEENGVGERLAVDNYGFYHEILLFNDSTSIRVNVRPYD